MGKLNKAALSALLVISIGVISHFDAEDSDNQHDLYCSMVATWHAQAKVGVPATDRVGWPPFNGECK